MIKCYLFTATNSFKTPIDLEKCCNDFEGRLLKVQILLIEDAFCFSTVSNFMLSHVT